MTQIFLTWEVPSGRMEKLDGAIPGKRRMVMSSELPRIKSKIHFEPIK